jgi:hypothetical protein
VPRQIGQHAAAELRSRLSIAQITRAFLAGNRREAPRTTVLGRAGSSVLTGSLMSDRGLFGQLGTGKAPAWRHRRAGETNTSYSDT